MRPAVLLLCTVAAVSLSQDDQHIKVVVHELDRRHEVAEQYFVEADMSFAERKLDEALPFYRAAARLCPEIASYVLKVALIEYQLNKFEEAFIHFVQALKVDPTNTVASFYIQKMKDERGFCLEEGCTVDWDEVTELQPIPSVEPFEAFIASDESSLQFPDFKQRSALPFVIRNAVQFLGGDLSLFAVDSLREKYGAYAVDFYPQNMLVKPTKVYNVPLSKALDYLAFPEGAYLSVDASSPGTYIQWSLNETTWDTLLTSTGLSKLPRALTHNLDTLLSSRKAESAKATVSGDLDSGMIEPASVHGAGDALKTSFGHKTHWYMVLVGEAGSGMFAHQDTLAVGSWQVQVAGSKSWRLCSPTPPFEPDILDPTPPAMGTEEGQVCYESVLHTGDIIYYPPYYWHETRNLETPSVALSGTVVVDSEVHPDVGNHVPPSTGSGGTYREALVSSLRAECHEDMKGFDFDDDFCELFV